MGSETKSGAILRAGGAYGAGFAIGTALIIILLQNPMVNALVDLLDPLQLFLRLLFEILLIFLIVGLGGGIAGAIGGRVLSDLVKEGDRRRFMWRSGFSFFVAHMLLVIPILLVTAVVAFFNPDIDVDFSILPLLFTVFGLVYGLLVGLLLGWLTVGLRNTQGVLLSAAVGFALGGALVGSGLFLFNHVESPSTFITDLFVIFCMLLFGLLGGGVLGFAYQQIKQARPLFPDSRAWRILRHTILVVIAFILLGAAGKLINTLTIRVASLSETLTLPTTGTHWTILEDMDGAEEPATAPPVTVSCDKNGQIKSSIPELAALPNNIPRCVNNPTLIEDGAGDLHLVWYSDEMVKVSGAPSNGHFLMESILPSGGDWLEPAIIARTAGEIQPTLTNQGVTNLVLSWTDAEGDHVAVLTPYSCDDVPLNDIGQAVYTAVRQKKYRPTSDIIPYCRNRYDQLLLTPNPTAPNSSLPSSEHGAFDQVADLVTEAEYEVLFTTMQWDKPSPQSSPGSTLAEAVADLYEKVKANPDAYPRGMTVRILLGNIPDLAIFEPTTQIYHTLHDLRDAGVTEMVNEEIGWQLEVADFEGAWPHAHSKLAIVDGKTALAVGFNYSYLHLPTNHPSGQGLDMTDKGIQITGPVAQASMSAYDDLWSGSDLVYCTQFPPPIPLLAFLWCDMTEAKASHPPEVLRFFPTDSQANAFSLHHTMAYLEADEAIGAAIMATEETIDLYEVNFSLHSACLLAIFLPDICEVDDVAPPYMRALVTAVVENDVKIRVIVEESAFNGFENRLGIAWLRDTLAEAGKLDNLEIRYGADKIHDKAVLIDDQFLIVGSHNFHWSAWDTPSLTEYSLATDDQTAVADFQQEFEHQWDLAIPVEAASP